jgi:hypothetical protein
MDVLLGWAAFGGGVLVMCVARSVLIGRARWRRGAATAATIGVPLGVAVILILLAFADDASTSGSGGMAGLAVPIFSLVALLVGGLGVALSKLVRGEFSSGDSHS